MARLITEDAETIVVESSSGVASSRSALKVGSVALAKDSSSASNSIGFREIAQRFGTDKVIGWDRLPKCLADPDTSCHQKDCVNPKCRPFGHFYDTIYHDRLGHMRDEEFQALEIGFYNGKGYESYLEYFHRAEFHSLEISCLPEGPRSEGKWPYGNFAEKNHRYQEFVDSGRLHCGDAADVTTLLATWRQMKEESRKLPLKLVIDDGSHLASHMAQSVFFWFPRIEPGGYMVVEDIQPTQAANRFRTEFLPQLMSDLHYCGCAQEAKNSCFPTLQPLLQSVYCEMHICVLQRNDEPALETSEAESTLPSGALSKGTCTSMNQKL